MSDSKGDMSGAISIAGRFFDSGVELIDVRTICGMRVPIVRATEEQEPELRDADGTNNGLYQPQRCVIVIRAGLPQDVEIEAIAHEVGHAFLDLSGLNAVLRGYTRRSGVPYEDVEETLVRVASPHLNAAGVGRMRK